MATKNGKVLQLVNERTINLNIVKSVSTSTLRDDWLVIHADSPEGDAVISCVFKTEMISHMLQQTGGRIGANVSETIQYSKKGGKPVTMKFVRDEKIRKDDVYKSHVVSVPSGEPANSVSYPACARKPKQAASTRSKPPAKRSAPISRVRPTPVASSNAPANARASMGSPSAAAARSKPVPPPPAPSPPPAAAEPSNPQYKCLYPFSSGEDGEISFVKDDIIEVLKQEDDNGWWLARKDGLEGWVPSNYLEEYTPPKAASPPPPPAPPARRPAPSIPSAASSKPSNPVASPRNSMTMGPAGAQAIPIPGMNGNAMTSNGVPAWKAQLEARKAQAAGGNSSPSPAPRPISSSGAPVPAARRTPPSTAPKPVIPPKSGNLGKPVIPARPNAGGGAPTPGPRAPPRPGSMASAPRPPPNQATNLADAVSVKL